MSKLTAFLSKSKKKTAPKTATASVDLATSVGSGITGAKGAAGSAEEAAPVLDVVQPKVLEQWRVDEDDVSEEVVAGGDGRTRLGDIGADDDDDGEVDLPSSKVKGNFEWKKKSEETGAGRKTEVPPTVTPTEKAPASIGGVLRLRRRDLGPGEDLANHESYPELKQAQPSVVGECTKAATGSSSATAKKSKSTVPEAVSGSKPQSVTSDGTAVSTVEKLLTADDIWSVLGGKWASKWGRVAVDEVLTRNRFQRMQFMTE